MRYLRLQFVALVLVLAPVALQAQPTIDVKSFGAKGGVRRVNDAAISEQTTVLTSATAAFTSADAGKTVEVSAAGKAGAPLIATITSVSNATTANLSAPAERSVTGQALVIAADDFEPIKRAIAAAVKGGATLQFPQDIYYTHSGWIVNGPLKIAGNGATLLFSIHGSWDTPEGLHFESHVDLKFPFSGAIKRGATTVKLSSIAGLSPGREVMLVLGTDPYDVTQPYVSQFNKISGISGNQVTLTYPIPEDISGVSHSLITFGRIVENVVIDNLIFDTPPHSVNTVDMPLYLYRTRNVRLTNVQMNYVPNGIAILNSDHVTVENFKARTVVGNNSSLNLIEAYNFVAHGVDIENNLAPMGIRMETQNRGVKLDNISIASEKAAAGLVGVQAYGHSTGVVIENFRFKPFERDTHVFVPLQIGEESEAKSRNMYLETTPPGTAQDLTTHSGDLQYEGVVYREIRSDSLQLPLTPDMPNVGIPLPDGITKAVSFFIKDKTGLTSIKALCGGCGGAFAHDLTPGLPPAGAFGHIKGVNSIGSIGPQFVFNEKLPPFSLRGKSLRVTTGGDVPAGDYLSLKIEYYPIPDNWPERVARGVATALFLLATSILAIRWSQKRSLLGRFSMPFAKQ